MHQSKNPSDGVAHTPVHHFIGFTNRARFFFIALLSTVFGLPGGVADTFGATKTWDGSSSGYWSAGANWSGGTTPVAGDDLVFPVSGVSRFTVTNDFIASPRAFRSITFEGSNFVVWGTNLVLTNGIDAVNQSGVNTIWNDVELRAPQTFLSFAMLADLVFNGGIALGTNTLTFNCRNGDIFVYNRITGSGGVTKSGAGVLRYGSDVANTYTGTTWVRAGTLLLGKLPGLDNLSGPLVIGEDGPVPNTDVVRLLANNQLPNDTDITLYASGLLDFNGFSDSVRDLAFNGGHVDAPSPGSIVLLGDITANSNTNSQAFISGRLSVASDPVINVIGHYFSPDISISAHVFGAGGLTKNGSGELSLNSSNSFTGLVTVNGGSLEVDDSFALGTTNAGTIVNAGASLAVRFDSAVPRETLSLAGTLFSLFGSNSWAGNITLTSNVTVFVRTNDFLNLSGGISDVTTSDLTKTGPGTLIFSGATANSYDQTIVSQGTLELAKSGVNGSIPGDLRIGDGVGGISADVVRITSVFGQIANASRVTITNSGLFDINTVTESVRGIEGSGRIDLGTGTLSIASTNEERFVFSGLIFGAGELQKTGEDVTLILSGNNTYTGITTVSGDGGSLIVDGSQPRSDIVIADDAHLGGSGVVGDISNPGGSIEPGVPRMSDPGILTCSNTFLHGRFIVDINGPSPGNGYDQLNVRGTNNIDAYLSVRVGGGFAPTEGQEFTILNNDGADGIIGIFSLFPGTPLPNNSIFTAETGEQFRIRYSAIFQNDVVLTFTNPAARVVTNAIVGGNGNGILDVNECNFINIVLTNTTSGVLSNVTGTLISKTPGVSVTYGTSTYPTIPVNARRTNSLPFQFSTSPMFVCGGNIQFDLVVTTSTNGSFTWPIVIGPTGCGNGGGGCESCPERTISGFLGTNSPVQLTRLFRDGLTHVCDEVRACPGPSAGVAARYFDAYTFENGESNACITVTLTSVTGDDLFSAAYTNFYNPSNICQNYMTDLGSDTASSRSYAFNVGPRAQFVLVVHGSGTFDAGRYTLAVTGGSCRPVLKTERVAGNQMALDWSTAAVGYGLQHTNRLPPTPNPIWIPSTPSPVIANSRFRVTNSVNGSNLFYQLRKP